MTDPMGAAIRDYHTRGVARPLVVTSSMFDDDEMPVGHLFRDVSAMPPLEQRALRMARGRVLDVGAAAGCHALPLQERGCEVTAIDISRLSVEVMQARGVRDARVADFFTARFETRFDTILLLMNGIGICGTMERLSGFYARLDELLAEGGSVLVDSTDLSYVYEDDTGKPDFSGVEGYYGEVDYCLHYGELHGEPFSWLYLDYSTLEQTAGAAGFCVQLVQWGEHSDFLVRLTRA